MMKRRTRRRVTAVATTAAWAALVLDTTHWGFDLADDVSRLVLTIAGVGSVLLAQIHITRPAAEVYEVGYEAGRRQGQIDEATRVSRGAEVVQFRRRAGGSG